MRVLQIGNFRPEHSTENHLLRAMRSHDWLVRPMQEDHPDTFRSLAWDDDTLNDVDVVLWTRTGWDWRQILPGGEDEAFVHQRQMLRRCRALGIPVVGYHLDIWFGLKRAYQVDREPFFESTVVITADGGHPDEWVKRGINHVWMPPAVSAPECEPGMFRDEFHSPLAFVGSWQGGYHDEHQHRFQLVRWLSENYPTSCAFYPRPGQPSVRGADLRDLYASVDVVIGDSCFAGSGLVNYWSDRIPETVGRGGYLLHPYVPGLEKQFPPSTLSWWTAGDWDALGALIEWSLAHPPDRREVIHEGRAWVLAHHTYEVRMLQVEQLLQERNLL